MKAPPAAGERGICGGCRPPGFRSPVRRSPLPALVLLGAILPAVCVHAAESLTFAQVLQRAAERDAALAVARYELERARLETVRIESSLGWVASGQAGASRDLNFFGVPTNRLEAGTNLDRRLESGSSVGFGLGVARDDAEAVVLPLLPNPLQSINVDARYRLPLRQGADNAEYRQALVTAEAGIEAAQAQFGAVRDALVRQVADLFYAASLTYARLRNARDAIERAERLRAFVQRNVRLGVAEDKDRLQAEAQLRARLTELRALQALWDNQRVALNRLMERDWEAEWRPRVEEQPLEVSFDLRALEAEAVEHSPELKVEEARIRAAEATIERRRDALRDQVDLVFSVGGRRLSGDTATGSISEADAVAGVRLEYRAALDKRGADAELAQAFLERDMARRRHDATLTDLRYGVARLAAEIDALAAALAQAIERRDAEWRKLEEANRRYRTGRADTAELILFENDYEAAVLAVEQQRIDLARRRQELARLRGAVWKEIEPPPAAPERRR